MTDVSEPSVEPEVKQEAEATRITEEEAINLMIGGQSTEAQTPESEEVEPEPSSDSTEEATEEEEVHSQNEQEQQGIDFDSLSEDQWDALADRLKGEDKSRLLERFGTLTAKRKQAEEEAAALRAQLEENKGDPLSTNREEDNPFKEIKTLNELREEAKKADDVIEWSENLLEQFEDASSGEVIWQSGDQSLTKADVKALRKTHQKNRNVHLPTQLKTVQRIEQAEVDRQNVHKQLTEQYDWMKDETSQGFKARKALMQGPVFKTILENNPEFIPYLEFLGAHAVNSMTAKQVKEAKQEQKKAVAPAGKAPPLTPPSSPRGGAAKSGRSAEQRAKDVEAAKNRAMKLGTEEAVIEYMVAKSQF